MGMSDYLESALLNHVFGGGDYTRVTTGYFGLFVSGLGETSTGHEVSGASYARASADNTTDFWANANTGAKWNLSALPWPSAAEAWGTATGIGIFDDSSAGNCLMYGNIAATYIASGEAFYIASGGLTITLD